MSEPERPSEHILHHAYDEAAVGLCCIDTELRYLHINRWLARLNGVPVEKHLGRTVHEVIPEVGSGIEAELRQVMETNTPVIGGVVEAKTPAQPGVLRTFIHDFLPVVADSGQVIGVTCVVQDITERRQAEVGLAARTAELERANRDLQFALDNITKLKGLRDFGGRLINAQETERRKIGRDLHDDLSQRMALLSIQLDRLALDHPELADALMQPKSMIQETSRRIQEIAYDLHPSRLATLGLVSTVELLCRDLHDQQTGFDVSCEVSRMPKRIPRDVSLCIYRVAQEALRNAMRHSGADGAVVSLDGVPGGVRLMVSDAGCGIQLPQENADGLGLVSMRERAALMGGEFSIRSAPGQGTHVTLEIPFEPT